MKIALIAHGAVPIPPRDWGAVEAIIWNQKHYLERTGHSVDIMNTRAIHEVIYTCNKISYDFVHCHNELFLLECLAHLQCPFAVTSHNWLLHHFDVTCVDRNKGFQYLFADTLRSPANIVLSDQIRDVYLSCGYKRSLHVLRNAAETDAFRIAPCGNRKAICVGMISARKRQAWLATLTQKRVAIDFVGPKTNGPEGQIEENETAKYLGTWDRETLHQRLTDYSCLVLLSRHEAAPMVIPEAFAAGLSVVVTEECSANLTDEPFITIIPHAESRADIIAQSIQATIDRNAEYREAIRKYAKERFDYAVTVRDYLQIIDNIRRYFADFGPWPSGKYLQTD